MFCGHAACTRTIYHDRSGGTAPPDASASSVQLLPRAAHGGVDGGEWNALHMKSALPRWRRMAGWAAYVLSGMLLCLFLALAYRYAQRWGWTFLMAVWVVWFATFLGGIGLGEWCWKADRETQARPVGDDDTPPIFFRRGQPQ